MRARGFLRRACGADHEAATRDIGGVVGRRAVSLRVATYYRWPQRMGGGLFQVRKIRPLYLEFVATFPLFELRSRIFSRAVTFRILISVGTRWRLTVGAGRQNNSKTQSQIILSQFFSILS